MNASGHPVLTAYVGHGLQFGDVCLPEVLQWFLDAIVLQCWQPRMRMSFKSLRIPRDGGHWSTVMADTPAVS